MATRTSELLHRLVIDAELVELNQPLMLEIEEGDGRVSVFAEKIGVGGCGNTLEEACLDFSRTWVGLYEELLTTPAEKLHESARAALDLFREYLLYPTKE